MFHKVLGGVRNIFSGVSTVGQTVSIPSSLFYVYDGVTGNKAWYYTRWNQVNFAFGQDIANKFTLSKAGNDNAVITFSVSQQFTICVYGNE